MSSYIRMKEKEALFPRERVAPLIKYDPDTGKFFRKVGEEWRPTGTKTKQGYVRVRVEGVAFPAHRLAFLLATGKWPEELVDHINGDPSDNRADNLREVGFSQNSVNNKVNRATLTESEMAQRMHVSSVVDAQARRVVIRMPQDEAAELEDLAFFSGASVASIARSAIQAGKQQVAYTKEQNERRRRIAEQLLGLAA